MENKIQVFESNKFGNVRVIEREGEPWFVAADVCKALEISNSRDALSRIDEDEKGVASTDTLGGKQDMTIVNESGLYSLVLGSRKPEAKQFKRWVTHDVIPSIRKHGAYMTPDTLENMISSPEFGIRLLTALKDEREKSARLAAQIESDRPKIDYYNTILQCKDAIPISVIAKDYGMSAAQMNKRLNELGIQYKQGGVWLLYQKYADQGYTNSSTFYFINEDGDKHSKVHTRWTQKGRLFLYDALKDAGVVPVCEVG